MQIVEIWWLWNRTYLNNNRQVIFSNMENEVQCKLHIFTRKPFLWISNIWSFEKLHPMHIQYSAFLLFYLIMSHTWTSSKVTLRQDPLIWVFGHFFTFLHHRIEEVERHLLLKFQKKIQMKSWSNVPPKLLACIRFLYKVVHKIGSLRKLNRAQEIEFNFFFTAWTIFMKLGTLVHHVHGYKSCIRFFNICLGT